MKRFGEKVIGDWQKDFIFASPMTYMVAVAQLARALVCGTKGRGFETHQPPSKDASGFWSVFVFIPNQVCFRTSISRIL